MSVMQTIPFVPSKHDGLSGIVKPTYRCVIPQSVRQGSNRGRNGAILVWWDLLRHSHRAREEAQSSPWPSFSFSLLPRDEGREPLRRQNTKFKYVMLAERSTLSVCVRPP